MYVCISLSLSSFFPPTTYSAVVLVSIHVRRKSDNALGMCVMGQQVLELRGRMTALVIGQELRFLLSCMRFWKCQPDLDQHVACNFL